MANEIIKGMGFHHIALKAKDFDRSCKFYTDLGMKPTLSWGEGDGRIQMFDLGDGGILELFAGGPDCPEQNARFMHFAMKADDIDAAYATALAAGAEPLTPPKFAPLDSKPFKVTLNIAFVKGPDGEELEFFRIAESEE